MEHHRWRKIDVILLTVMMLMTLISEVKLDVKTEAMSSSLMQANEKLPTAKQSPNQQQQQRNSSSRARSSSAPIRSSSSSTKQNRSSASLVRLSKQQQQSSPQQPLDPIRDYLAGYRNTPPLFVTPTRDLVVDVATSRPGKTVSIIHANDGDGDTLRFQLNQAAFQDASPYFTITNVNSTSGELRLAAKQFKYRLAEEQQPEQEAIIGDDADEAAPSNGGQNAATESALNSYFLNVGVDDGHYDSTVELKIHVTNSTLMKMRILEGIPLGDEVDTETHLRQLEKVMRDKSRVFFDSLSQMSPTNQGNSSIGVVYPDFVNPGLNVKNVTTTDEPSTVADSSPQSSGEVSGQVVKPITTTPTIMPMSLSSPPSSSSSSQMISASSSNEHTGQPAAAAPEHMVMNLVMVMCACLMIALVLLMFIIPLTVKRLRKRIKHVERQHEHLSQKTSNVSSTLGSSLASTTHQQHQPSLSQFTLGSDISNSCLRRDSSNSVFRQSSLDSAMTFATMSPPAHHHQFNRVDNGSIANPVYLHQHRQHYQHNHPATMYAFKNPSERDILMQQQQQQMFGLQASNLADNENVYSALSDEFYSTIQTDMTPLGGGSGSNFSGQQQIQGFTASNYLMAQCAQPDVAAFESRPLDSPDSNASSPALRSLTRFLSLPAARHHSLEQETAAKDSSTIRELETQLGRGAFSTMRTTHQVQQSLGQFNAKTIARTYNVDREQGNAIWELERHRLRIPWVLLDEGQFGQVWRCKLSPGPRQADRLVAVKSLKKNSVNGERGRGELLAEIEIMKLVCNHPNVVKLLHCCTLDDSKPILLVMEYIEQGKLQSYLEKSRLNHHYSTGTFAAPVPDEMSHNHYHQHRHQLSMPNNTMISDYLTSRDLMKFIYHVAKGMEYISSKCIVHRDLASRNILVSEEKICKIGDFGMARHMQSSADVYDVSGNCKIPVRWMAPEVLLSNSFTTKSDVFSFGILMWEIITLGSTPYTHLKTQQVIDRVARNGERPERPEYCHPQLYNIMSRCWQPEPAARPTFKDLVEILGELVLSANNYIELDQYPDHDYYNIPKTAAPDELL